MRTVLLFLLAATACGASEAPSIRRITITASTLGQDTAVELASGRVVPLPPADTSGNTETIADLSVIAAMQVSLGSTRGGDPDTPELCPRGMFDALEDIDADDTDCMWTPRDYFAGNTQDPSVAEAVIGKGYLASDGDGLSRFRIHVVDAGYSGETALDFSLTFELERLR